MRKTAPLLAAVLTTFAFSQASAADLPGKGVTVKPAQSTIAEEGFQTLLVSRALEKLGYTVEKPSEIDYNVAYTSIAAGDLTFVATNWQPLHDDMYNAAGGDKKFYRAGTYVSGAAQGYLIDKKTAEQYHITNIAQLKDPENRAAVRQQRRRQSGYDRLHARLGLRSGHQSSEHRVRPERYRDRQYGQLLGDGRRYPGAL